MNILLIHQFFITKNDPGGTRHFEFASYLKKKGHRVTVVTSDIGFFTGRGQTGIEQPVDDNGLTIMRVRTFKSIHASISKRLISFLSYMANSFITSWKVKNIDIVFGTSPPLFQGIAAYAISRVRRKPFVFEVRDLWPDFMVEIGAIRNTVLIMLARWAEKLLYKKADLLIINSPGFREHLEKRGARKEKICFIPNSVDTSMFSQSIDGSSFRNEMGLQGFIIVLYAGAIGRSNDILTLLNAAALLQDETNIRLVLVGGGNERDLLEETAREMQLTNVIFIDPQPKSRMPEIMAAADITIAILKDIPLFKTTYPNKVFDYMAAEKPIVLAIDGVIRKVVEEANAGIFVKPGNPAEIADGIKRLSFDKSLREEMGMNGRKYVELHFERDKQSEKLERVLRELLGASME